MKLAVFLVSSLFAAQAFAVPAICTSKSEKAVHKASSRYDGEHVFAYDCAYAHNGAAVICEVAAEKGGGDAVDTWRVVLSKTCSRVYRTEMIGEE